MEEPKKKKEYTEPKLTCYGTLADMTKQSGNVGDDGFLGSRRKI